MIRRLLATFRRDASDSVPFDAKPEHRSIVERCRPFSMTPAVRLVGLCEAVEYVVHAKVPGAFVECGVWRGGSCMAMALTLAQLGQHDREIYLYDTFAGMTQPSAVDIDLRRQPAHAQWLKTKKPGGSAWCEASLDEVQRNMATTGYPSNKIRFIQGDVQVSLQTELPAQIALLRLDTDFYQSTLAALEQLYPRLAPSGVLIIDDFGHWLGARKAVEEYFAAHSVSMLLQRLDYSARIGVKPV